MQTKEYKYKAFISYRHLPYDKAVANKLQQMLENYQPPAPLRAKDKSHWRLFRDETELPTSSALGQDIHDALEQSEFLICVCSEAYLQSKWCMAEIIYFKSLHHGSIRNIIPILIDGTPETSFPNSLLFDDETQQPVEPLAANITSDTEKESMQRLRSTEYLRIAAQMIHCEFNDLYQREKRRERKKRMLIRTAVGSILILIGGISAAYMTSLSHKNTEILRQNDLLESNQKLIEAQNQDLLIENAKQLSIDSAQLFQNGEYVSALQTALDALPSDHTSKPVLPEAERTLSRELFAFQAKCFLPEKALTHDTVVEDVLCTNNGQTAVTRDAYSIYVWNIQTGSLLQKYPLSDFRRTADLSSSYEKICFYHAADCPAEEAEISPPGFVLYGVEPGLGVEIKERSKKKEPSTPASDPIYIYNGYGDIWKLSDQTGEILWKNAAESQAGTTNSVLFRENDAVRILYDTVRLETLKDKDEFFAEQIDLDSGNVQKRIPILTEENPFEHFVPKSYDSSVLTGYYNFLEQYHFIVLREEDDGFHFTQTMPLDDDNPLAIGNTFKIGDYHYALTWRSGDLFRTVIMRQYDASFQKELWHTSLTGAPDRTNEHFILFRAEDTKNNFDVLAAILDGEISLINAETGEVLLHYCLNSNVSACYYSKKGYLFVIDKSAHEYALDIKFKQDGTPFQSQSVNELRSFVTGTALCGYCNDTYVTADGSSNIAYVYTESANPDYDAIEPLAILPEWKDKDFNLSEVAFDSTAQRMAFSYYIQEEGKRTDYFCLYDRESGQRITTPYDSGYTADCIQFMEDNKLLLILHPADDYHTQVHLYDTEQKKEIAFSENEVNFFDPWYTSSDETCTIFLGSTDSRKSFAVHSDGTIDMAPDLEAETRYSLPNGHDFKGKRKKIYAFAPSAQEYAAVMLTPKQYGPDAPEQEYQLTICSFAKQSYRSISLESSGITTDNIHSLFYFAEGQLCVVNYDGSILCFDTEHGNQLWKTDTADIPSAVLKCTSLNDSSFLLLGTDMCLYCMSKDGFTGKKVQLSFDLDELNNYYCSENNKLDSRILSEDHAIMVTLEDYNAKTDALWLLDPDSFTVRYHMDRSFISYGSAEHRLYVYDLIPKTVGSFPIYSTDQLVTKAQDYINKLNP